MDVDQFSSDHRQCVTQSVQRIAMRHTFKGDREQDVRIEHPSRVSEFSRADGVWTLASSHEASRKRGEPQRLQMLVILGLAGPQKTHEPIHQLSA